MRMMRDSRHGPLRGAPPAGDSGGLHAVRVVTPFAVIGIVTAAAGVTRVDYLPADTPPLAPSDPLAARAARELERYLVDPHAAFTVPLAPKGTPYQRRVWDAIAAIPVGASRTYGELATKLMSAPRAVGQACGSNPLALIVPCHRVVGSRGALGGFMHAATGSPLAVKRWLLEHEGYRFGR